MSLPVVDTSTSVEVAVTATAATLTGALDNGQQTGRATYEIVASTGTWYAQGPADTTFTADAATDQLTAVSPAAFDAATGTGPVQVSNSGGGLPAGLTAATNYWIVAVTGSPGKIQLATSRANAI